MGIVLDNFSNHFADLWVKAGHALFGATPRIESQRILKRFPAQVSKKRGQTGLGMGIITVTGGSFFGCPMTMGSASLDLCDRDAA